MKRFCMGIIFSLVYLCQASLISAGEPHAVRSLSDIVAPAGERLYVDMPESVQGFKVF